jgi:enterochelin esterase-like enzyme
MRKFQSTSVGIQEFMNQFDCMVTNNQVVIRYFSMPQLEIKRCIRVYLPPDYDETNDSYPVLYLNDGQDFFEECPINNSIKALLRSERMKGVIVVGIDSIPDRRRIEYNPLKLNPKDLDSQNHIYASFLIDTLKPFIDKTFRSKPDREYTGIGGFSAGAIAGLYIGLKYSNIFSRIAAFSLTLPAYIEQLMMELDREYIKKFPMKIYMDLGTEEEKDFPREIRKYFVPDFTVGLYKLQNFMLGKGFEESELKVKVGTGTHSISAVASRFSTAFLWLYDEPEQPFKVVIP